jgi:branched-chain amino acid transport system ATP-binding protein
LLEASGLCVAYGGVHALRDVSVRVADRGVVAVIGANGAGKSTLLKTIAGLVRQASGSVRLDGQDISGLKPHERLDRGIVLCPEGRRLFPDLTVYENIRMGAYRMRDNREFRSRLDFLYGIFPRVAERRKQLAASLSGGEQQMVAIARALTSAPKLLLLDEPSGGLAPKFVEEIGAVMMRLKEVGTTMLMVEQNLRLALSAADRFLVLKAGRVSEGGNLRQGGSPEAIVQSIYF